MRSKKNSNRERTLPDPTRSDNHETTIGAANKRFTTARITNELKQFLRSIEQDIGDAVALPGLNIMPTINQINCLYEGSKINYLVEMKGNYGNAEKVAEKIDRLGLDEQWFPLFKMRAAEFLAEKAYRDSLGICDFDLCGGIRQKLADEILSGIGNDMFSDAGVISFTAQGRPIPEARNSINIDRIVEALLDSNRHVVKIKARYSQTSPSQFGNSDGGGCMFRSSLAFCRPRNVRIEPSLVNVVPFPDRECSEKEPVCEDIGHKRFLRHVSREQPEIVHHAIENDVPAQPAWTDHI